MRSLNEPSSIGAHRIERPDARELRSVESRIDGLEPIAANREGARQLDGIVRICPMRIVSPRSSLDRRNVATLMR